MSLEKPGKYQPGFHLAKGCPNASARPAAKGNVSEWRMFLTVSETRRLEIVRVVPVGGVAMGQIDRVKHPLPGRNTMPIDIHAFRNTAVTNMDRWVESQAFFDNLIQQGRLPTRRSARGLAVKCANQVYLQAGKNLGMLT